AESRLAVARTDRRGRGSSVQGTRIEVHSAPRAEGTELVPVRPTRTELQSRPVTQTRERQATSLRVFRAVVHAGLSIAAAFLVGFFIMSWVADPSRTARAQQGPESDNVAKPLLVQREDPIGDLRGLVRDLEDRGSLQRADLNRFGEAVAALETQRSRLTVKDVFWIAEAWKRLGDRATQPELAGKCYQQAASAYAFAGTIAAPETERGSVANQRMRAMLADAKAKTTR
ncbi:MAG: hypothetical protein AAFX06_25945, partial [Planctomycetota bacterium]